MAVMRVRILLVARGVRCSIENIENYDLNVFVVGGVSAELISAWSEGSGS